MANKVLFSGLIYDENEQLLETAFVGSDAFYVIDDAGFKRHVDAEVIDREVVNLFLDQLSGNEGMAVEQAMSMMGKDDLFTKAALDASINNVDADQILQQGVPAQARDMLAMLGFRIIVNYRGEVVRVDQPNMPEDGF